MRKDDDIFVFAKLCYFYIIAYLEDHLSHQPFKRKGIKRKNIVSDVIKNYKTMIYIFLSVQMKLGKTHK